MPTTVPVGAVLVAQVSKSASHACTLVPIARPKLVLAVAASEAPVPPSATAKSVIQVIAPPLIVADVIVSAATVLPD